MNDNNLFSQALIDSFSECHQLYKFRIKQFWTIFFLLLLGFVLLTISLALEIIMGEIGEKKLLERIPAILPFLLLFWVGIAVLWSNVLRSRKKLDSLKSQLEEAGYFLCYKNEYRFDNENVQIINNKYVKTEYLLFPVDEKIDFGLYDRTFKV